MADILIRGMEMPTNVDDCPLNTFGFCNLAHDSNHTYCIGDSRPEWCPLLPLPKGHGRLGDLDALLESMRESYQKAQEWRDNSSGEIYDRADATVMAFLEFGNRTKNAPTIVPAEGGTDNG